jgi:hypothetical protein
LVHIGGNLSLYSRLGLLKKLGLTFVSHKSDILCQIYKGLKLIKIWRL